MVCGSAFAMLTGLIQPFMYVLQGSPPVSYTYHISIASSLVTHELTLCFDYRKDGRVLVKIKQVGQVR